MCRFVVRFILRSGGNTSATLRQECEGRRDVFCLPSILASETRLRGPTLCTFEWLRHALLVLNAELIVKTDDDVWLDLEMLYHATRAMPADERVVYGAVSWWHWLPSREKSLQAQPHEGRAEVLVRPIQRMLLNNQRCGGRTAVERADLTSRRRREARRERPRGHSFGLEGSHLQSH